MLLYYICRSAYMHMYSNRKKCWYAKAYAVQTNVQPHTATTKMLANNNMLSQCVLLLLRSHRIIKTPTTLHHTNAIQTEATFFVDLLIDNLEQLSLPCAPPALPHTYTHISAHTCAYNCILFSFLVY